MISKLYKDKMKNFLYLILFLIISCAGKNVLEDPGTEVDIEKVFKLKKGKIKQFSIVKKDKQKKEDSDDAPNESANHKEKTLKPSIKSKEEKKVIQKEIEKKVIKEKPEEKKLSKKEEVVQKPQEEFIVPWKRDDYPEAFKKYNKRYEKFWESQNKKYYSGEKFTFDISWTIFRAGTATIEIVDDLEVAGKDAFMLKAKMESAEYFENIYKLNNTLTTYISKENFFPIKYEMRQRESGQNVDDVQLFDEKELKTYFYYKRLKEGKVKEKSEEKYIPRFFTDSFSALFFVRGLPLKVGYKFGFPMVTRTKVWLLKAEVVGTEKIEILGQDVETFKVKAVTQFPGVLKKRGDIVFWFSKDSLKRLLKFEAKVKIGSVKGELIDYRPGK